MHARTPLPLSRVHTLAAAPRAARAPRRIRGDAVAAYESFALKTRCAGAGARSVCARHAAPPPPRARAIARATVATRASEARNLLRCSCAFRERPRPVARSAGGAAAAPPGAAPRDARWLAVGSRAAHYRDGPASGRNAARARRAASLRAAARHLRDTRHALRLVARAGDGGGLFRGLPRHAWYGQLRWNQPTPVESANSGGISQLRWNQPTLCRVACLGR